MKVTSDRHRPTLLWAMFVFALAFFIRLPSCYESFWVDELHTAWAIWSDFGDVSERAAQGNQTPLYFRLMWIWKACVGPSEVALRVSSVFAVALGCALLVLGVKQSTGRLAAGVLAGTILAIESNSLFFGTEFRPYAMVMLLSVIATWAAVALVDLRSRESEAKLQSGNQRLILVTAVCLAVLIHPTSVVTLGLLPLVVFLLTSFSRRQRFRLQISDFISLILVAAVLFSLADSSLSHSWEHRSQWRAFGKAVTWKQLWIIWPWLLMLIPMVGLVLALTRKPMRDVAVAIAIPLVVGVAATVIFFVASYYDWVPLWHRRYMVAVLPMLAWSSGASVTLVPKFGRFDFGGVCVTAGLLAFLFWQQGSWLQFQRTSTWIEPRGEDWRGAADWIRQNRNESELVGVDAGLIESNTWLTKVYGGSMEMVIDPVENRYLSYAVSGPYRLRGAIHQELRSRHFVFYAGMGEQVRPTAGWLISRTGEQRALAWAKRSYCMILESRSFGRVRVMRYRRRTSQSD